MASVVFYFELHQPFRLRRYSVFDTDPFYFDNEANERILRKVADKCYRPTTLKLLDLVRRHDRRFRVSFSVSGTALKHLEDWAPDVLDTLRRLVDTGACELLDETSHHSLAFLFSRQEFDRQQARRWLLGIQRHKQAPELLDALLAPGDAVGVVAIPDHRSWSAAELLAERPSLAGRIEALPELTAGLDWVTAAEPLPVVTGSLHLLGALIPLLDPAEPG
jgi:hypothetical protein